MRCRPTTVLRLVTTPKSTNTASRSSTKSDKADSRAKLISYCLKQFVRSLCRRDGDAGGENWVALLNQLTKEIKVAKILAYFRRPRSRK